MYRNRLLGESFESIILSQEQIYRAMKNAGVKTGLYFKPAQTAVDGYYFGASGDSYIIENSAWTEFKNICGLPQNVDDATLKKFLMAWLPEYKEFGFPKKIETQATEMPITEAPIVVPTKKKLTDYINPKSLIYIGGGLIVLAFGSYALHKIKNRDKQTF